MRVMTYNILRPIWARPGWESWRTRRVSIARVLGASQPDYVALQEETPAMVEELLLQLPGYRYLATAPEPSYRNSKYGMHSIFGISMNTPHLLIKSKPVYHCYFADNSAWGCPI